MGIKQTNFLDTVEKKKKEKRQSRIDAIYTDGWSRGLCCMACQAGLKFGIQSGAKKTCPRIDEKWHGLVFVDCNYKKYNHEIHLNDVKKYRPKYATVRDVMSRGQCQKAGIEYFELPQILDWAEELNEYANNVIVIPKFDCLDKIPEKFMLGYSTPTSYGTAANIPIEEFKQWGKVHILGGSWKRQLELLEYLGGAAWSFDNNYISKVGIYGTFVYGDGSTGKVEQDLNIFDTTNHWHIATVISFGSIAGKIKEL